MTDDFSEEEKILLSKTLIEHSVAMGWALPSLEQMAVMCKEHGGKNADLRCFLLGYFFGAKKAAEETINLVKTGL